MGHRSLG